MDPYEYQSKGLEYHKKIKSYAEAKKDKLESMSDKNKFTDYMNSKIKDFYSVVDDHKHYHSHLNYIDSVYDMITDKSIVKSPQTVITLLTIIAFMLVFGLIGKAFLQ